MILGPQEELLTLALEPADDPTELAARLREALPAPGTGALILVDLFGASPANAAAALLRDRDDIEIVSGASLPMLVEVLAARDSGTARQLAERALAAGRESVRDVGGIIRAAIHPAPEEVSR